jgi:hypothetical protein
MGNMFSSINISEGKDAVIKPTGATVEYPKIFLLPTHNEEVTVWYASIDDVTSIADDSELVKSLLPGEKAKVNQFMFPDDRKRALLSILLQRALIRTYFGISDFEYEIRRSKEVSVVSAYV